MVFRAIISWRGACRSDAGEAGEEGRAAASTIDSVRGMRMAKCYGGNVAFPSRKKGNQLPQNSTRAFVQTAPAPETPVLFLLSSLFHRPRVTVHIINISTAAANSPIICRSSAIKEGGARILPWAFSPSTFISRRLSEN